jgi:hypothetical protein
METPVSIITGQAVDIYYLPSDMINTKAEICRTPWNRLPAWLKEELEIGGVTEEKYSRPLAITSVVIRLSEEGEDVEMYEGEKRIMSLGGAAAWGFYRNIQSIITRS